MKKEPPPFIGNLKMSDVGVIAGLVTITGDVLIVRVKPQQSIALVLDIEEEEEPGSVYTGWTVLSIAGDKPDAVAAFKHQATAIASLGGGFIAIVPESGELPLPVYIGVSEEIRERMKNGARERIKGVAKEMHSAEAAAAEAIRKAGGK